MTPPAWWRESTSLPERICRRQETVGYVLTAAGVLIPFVSAANLRKLTDLLGAIKDKVLANMPCLGRAAQSLAKQIDELIQAARKKLDDFIADESGALKFPAS